MFRYKFAVGLTALLLCPSVKAAAVEAPFYRAELIFKPSLRFPRCHASTITELPDGSLMAAWWNGTEEAGSDLVIRSSRRPAGGDRWEPPRITVDTPDTTMGTPVLFVPSQDEVWLFYRVGRFQIKKIMWQKSTDLGRTWSRRALLWDVRNELGNWAYRSRIIRLKNGDILVPINASLYSTFLYSSDAGETWRRSEMIKTEPRNNEPTVMQRTDGSLLAFLRPHDPDPADSFLWQSESFDNGRTWTEAKRTSLKNPSSAVELLKLRSGNAALVFNDSQETRSPLCLALSSDDGKSWSHKRVLEDAPRGRFSYPTMFQSADGHIHLSYTFRRKSIKHVEVNEAWIMEVKK